MTKCKLCKKGLHVFSLDAKGKMTAGMDGVNLTLTSQKDNKMYLVCMSCWDDKIEKSWAKLEKVLES